MRRAALALLLLTGCGPSYATPPGRPLDVTRYYLNPRGALALDPAFTEKERSAIDRGVVAWREKTGGCVALTYHPDGLPVRRQDSAPDTNGRAVYRGRPAIYLDPGRSNAAAARTAAHEIGHQLGLSHDTSSRECIMFTPNTGRLTFCENDIDRVRALWHCGD